MEKGINFEKELEIKINSLDLVKTLPMTPEAKRAGDRLDYLGLDADKFLLAWQDSHSSLDLAIKKNLPRIENLEKTMPGISQALNKYFGIYNFGRHPEEILEKQFSQMEQTNLRYGIIATSRNDISEKYPKWSDAYFDKSWGECLTSLNKQLGDEYALRIFEAGDVLELAKQFALVKKKYAKFKKADFAIISAHGNRGQVHLGKGGLGKQVWDVEDFEDQRLEKYSEIFNRQAPIVLDACDTGQDNGFGIALADCFHREVIAPMGTTSLKSIKVRKLENLLFFDVSYGYGVEANHISG